MMITTCELMDQQMPRPSRSFVRAHPYDRLWMMATCCVPATHTCTHLSWPRVHTDHTPSGI